MRLFKLFVVLSVLAMAASHARAVVIVDQLPVDAREISYQSERILGEQEGDDITVPASSWGLLEWSGVYFGGTTADNFSVRIYREIAGVPETTPFMIENIGAPTRVGTGILDVRGLEIFNYTKVLTNFGAVPAGDYQFSIVNETPTRGWLWSAFDNTVGGFFRGGEGSTWVPHTDPTDFAFRINAALIVPEPATAVLAMLALPALLLLRRRTA